MRLAVIFLMCVVGLLAQGCSTNLATGKKQVNWLTTPREISIGTQATPGFIEGYGGQIPSEAIQQYVAGLGLRLAQASERPDLPWEFHVLDSQSVNAFALPGGKVFVTRGLLAHLENEAQLAGVLGHEIGHVTAQHVGQQMTQSLVLQTAMVGIGLAAKHSDKDWLGVLGMGTQVGGTAYLLKFGRDQESEADTLGLRYMTRLGYSPVGQLQVMGVLKRELDKRSQVPEILSTHPLPSTRLRRLEAHIGKQYSNHDDPRLYRFNYDQFKTAVLGRLKNLPAPVHGVK